MLQSKDLSTAEVIKKFEVTRNALRLYEDMGLLAKVIRSDAGYRKFSVKDLEDLNFILEAKDSGFTLNEIKDFLQNARMQPSLNCEDVSLEVEKKLNDIDAEIIKQNKKRKFLKSFLETCGSKSKDSKCTVTKTGFDRKSCC